MKVRIHMGYIDDTQLWVDKEFKMYYPHAYTDADVPEEVLNRWESAISEYHEAEEALQAYLPDGKWNTVPWPGEAK